jgi:hypothetical protein
MPRDRLSLSRVTKTRDDRWCVFVKNNTNAYAVLLCERARVKRAQRRVPGINRREQGKETALNRSRNRLDKAYVAQNLSSKSFVFPATDGAVTWDIQTQATPLACTCANWAFRGVSNGYSRLQPASAFKTRHCLRYLDNRDQDTVITRKETVPENNVIDRDGCKHMLFVSRRYDTVLQLVKQSNLYI